MRISELIVKLATIADAEGDLDVIHRTGDMDDPYPIDEAEVADVDKGGSEKWPDFHIPGSWETRVTNAKAVVLS